MRRPTDVRAEVESPVSSSARRWVVACFALASLTACGREEAPIIEAAKGPPGARLEGASMVVPFGNALILTARMKEDEQGTITMSASGAVRVLATTRSDAFVVIGDRIGDGSVGVRVDGRVTHEIAARVIEPP